MSLDAAIKGALDSIANHPVGRRLRRCEIGAHDWRRLSGAWLVVLDALDQYSVMGRHARSHGLIYEVGQMGEGRADLAVPPAAAAYANELSRDPPGVLGHILVAYELLLAAYAARLDQRVPEPRSMFSFERPTDARARLDEIRTDNLMRPHVIAGAQLASQRWLAIYDDVNRRA